MSGKENQRFKEKSYLRHPLCCQSETNSDGGEEALRYVRHNDPDEEDDSVEPVVAEDEGDDEESDSEEDGDTGDDVDEMGNFLGNWSITSFQSSCQSCNSAHDSVIANIYHDSFGSAFDSVSGKKGQIPCFQWILMGEIWRSCLWFRFTSQ